MCVLAAVIQPSTALAVVVVAGIQLAALSERTGGFPWGFEKTAGFGACVGGEG